MASKYIDKDFYLPDNMLNSSKTEVMIEYDDFNLRPYISDYLFADNYLLAPGDLKGGISFEESVNDGEVLEAEIIDEE